ncbi:HD domain protein [Rickettsia endosymbiont of Ixodes pacificus]|uniref:HD domain-containing protein n=1 Tax=Rickettsia endosymbiont of Ixodes pacificus TaxID=1133329 RepID=UPI0005F86101|nr:HD domain-containing protein [Rickettsia endosymbiont of Ixodes pacificus]KJW03167.1 HD domain protein [Rickettsia endosymbiont of Ixodes pacificus]
MEDISSWKEKFEICVYSKKLLDKLEYLNTKVENPIDILEIKKGIYYARKYHGSQMRQSGDPYYSHPIEVAIMLAEFVAEEAPKLYNVIMLQAALLHDTIKDTELTEEAITEIFGPEVAKHVEGLTRIKSYGKISSGESLNLLIKEKRYNTALIKLFDRIHNVQTLGVKSPEKARKIIEETLINFLLIAANINYKLEQEFAELCLKVFNIELERQKAFSNNNSLLPPLTL